MRVSPILRLPGFRLPDVPGLLCGLLLEALRLGPAAPITDSKDEGPLPLDLAAATSVAEDTLEGPCGFVLAF